MERKLATVLFVDLVDSSALVSGTDPEVVRRRVTRFFERVSHCVEAHGGTVEKFAGDAVMAAFGVPRAHEDDAARALRAALSIRDAVHELQLEARLGLEAGEVVVGDADSTFATGEAVNLAARLQQLARPGEILVGPGAYRLAFGRIELESAGVHGVRGLRAQLPVWRALGVRDGGRPLGSLSAPLIGRDSELELLENTFERTTRSRRPHLVTVYGEPGVGKSRLAREFVSAVEGATVLSGRCLPYGEGITYWSLAEMVKAAAGISDDDPVDEAHEKLLVCCEDEAVADLLGLAAGVLEAVQGERSQQEIAWAAREWAESMASAQPLVLVFEDIHWAEEPLLELIEHLAGSVRDAPLLILCLARPELLEVRPAWGGGRLRATAVELEPLPREDSEQLVEALVPDDALPRDLREALLDKTEGNPLFVEETVRMVLEGDGDGRVPIPDTLHALIAARIDRLPLAEKLVLQRASVVGRIFWAGAVVHLSPDVDDPERALERLLERDFVLREPRSSITGDRAYRYKHVLIREVAYAGLAKFARAEHHRRFAEWLRERAGEELLEIRAYHLDQATALAAELDGAPPAELASEAAAALAKAGRRAFAREANRAARRMFLRSVELEPTLERRYLAAKAAWRLGDLPAVCAEMERVRDEAEDAGDRRLLGRALTVLAHASLYRDADLAKARALGNRALAVVEEDDAVGRFDALDLLGTIGWWEGDLSSVERYAEEKLAIAEAAGRKDLESEVLTELGGLHDMRFELDRARELLDRALALAEESGSLRARGWALREQGEFHARNGDLGGAKAALEEARRLFTEVGSVVHHAGTLNWLATIARRTGELARAERLLREAIGMLKPLGDRGTIVESQRRLAEVLVEQGKVDEAEQYALQAYELVGAEDASSRATTRMALGIVRSAQRRDDEAERLLREAVEIYAATDFRRWQVEPLAALARFLRERGRDAEAAEVETRAADLAEGAPARVA